MAFHCTVRSLRTFVPFLSRIQLFPHRGNERRNKRVGTFRSGAFFFLSVPSETNEIPDPWILLPISTFRLNDSLLSPICVKSENARQSRSSATEKCRCSSLKKRNINWKNKGRKLSGRAFVLGNVDMKKPFRRSLLTPGSLAK